MGIVAIDGIPVYQALVDSADTGMLRISLVDDPAVQSNFVAFRNEHPSPVQRYAIEDEEKRLILGCIMRADFPIYRRDADGFEYYIIYKADTIRTMAEKYLAENRQNLVNLMHEDGTDVDGVQMVQYFIKGAGLNPEGFDAIADGSLFGEFHVTNDEVWDAIKAGTYKGFSLEGVFDLRPERDKAAVEEIVESLDGLFARILPKTKYNKMKKKGILARLAAMLVEMGNVSTDKGVLAWDGDEDLKEGDAVYIEDENGERSAAADGDYVTGDGKTIVVVNGRVSEIRDPKAEVAPEAPAEEEAVEETAEGTPARFVETDKGKLSWDNEDEDLKAGDAVYVTDEEGNRQPAPDGDYTTEDGKVITVADGKVASIVDNKAEVEEKKDPRFTKIKEAFEESFDTKTREISKAIGAALGHENFYLVDAGDDFGVVETWDHETWESTGFFRYAITWNEDGTANASDPQEVKQMFVPKDMKSPFDLQAENASLKSQIETLSRTPAAKPAHEEFSGSGEAVKTGNKGLDRLAKLMAAK